MRILVIAIIVLLLGGLFIANTLQTDFKSINSSMVFTKIYIKWIAQVAGNLKELASIAYNMDWLPKAG